MKRQTYLLISLLAVVWGSSFILMKRGLLVYTPVQVGAFRMVVSFVCMLPMAIPRLMKVERSKWKYLALSGLLGNGIPSILFPLAETRISGALAGMINSMTPIFTLIVGMLLFGMKAGKNRVFGLAIGLLGALLMIAGQTGKLEISGNNFAYYVVLATICYAFSVNILRYKLGDLDVLTNSSLALFFIGIPMGILLFTTDFISRTTNTPGSGMSLFYICILAVFGTALSTIFFNRLIKVAGALAASSVTYLIPVVAVMWGLFDNEKVGFYHLLGLIGILVGVYLISKKKV